VVSTGHKAVHHLLHKVEDAMRQRKKAFRGLYKHNSEKPHSEYVSRLENPFIVSTPKNGDFDSLRFDLAGGTAWLFSRAELCGAFDYVFIDEAGQLSLADALAVSACTRNVVLLGDPAQLAQVSQGTHPHRAGWSVLEHILGDEPTVPPDRGVFLDVSYRMQPEICSFISDAMYDRRLRAAPQTANHSVRSSGLTGGGLRYFPIEHYGNSASSLEEADRIVGEIALLREGFVTDDDGIERKLADRDVIVVTPYNAQRRLIERRLREAGSGVAVGTVDKFQGQEAAVVFYSMATSSSDDVPRDLDFLFEQNRFNVAVSRARALSVLVCSPRLLDASCNSPEQMAMINFLCAYVEKSTLPPRPGVSAAMSADRASLSG
jgi:superfamily I DNA and/or RNA helicase